MLSKILHTILALSVFFSTTGFTLSRHYCRNQLQGIGFFAPPTQCEHVKKMPCCKGHNGCAMHQEKDKKGCCHNSITHFKLDQDKQILPIGFKLLKKPVGPIEMLVVPFSSLSASGSHLPFYQLFKPPIVCSDFQVLLQTFRL
ncbi:MAG: hypothetical protein IPL49_14305 [Saprospirales bacterium]|nr:hypothetical protein [Saprospirales bacterium]MBK8492018.1 hypothetical protein [Saprospirales bacterium]